MELAFRIFIMASMKRVLKSVGMTLGDLISFRQILGFVSEMCDANCLVLMILKIIS